MPTEKPPTQNQLVHAYRDTIDIRSLCGNVYVREGRGVGTDDPKEVTCTRCLNILEREAKRKAAWANWHPTPVGSDALTEKDPAMRLVFELRRKKAKEALEVSRATKRAQSLTDRDTDRDKTAETKPSIVTKRKGGRARVYADHPMTLAERQARHRQKKAEHIESLEREVKRLSRLLQSTR